MEEALMKHQNRLITAISLALACLPTMAFSASNVPATPKSLNQRNLALILDLDDTEGQEGLNANQAELANHIMANQSCIITSACTLQHTVNSAHGIGIDKDDSLIQEAKKACHQLDAFETYRTGDLWVLLPKTIAPQYKEELNLAGLTVEATPKPIETKAVEDEAPLANKTPPVLSLLAKIFKKQEKTTWNIFITGHGDGHGKVCGMADSGLKKLLDFFAAETNTRTLTYSSCYGGGQVTDYLLPQTATYPYLILCQGLGENVLYAITGEAPTIFSNVLRIQDINNLDEVIACLPNRAELADHEKYSVFNSYQIRLPNSTSFVIPPVADATGTFTTMQVNQQTTDAELQNAGNKDLILDATYVSKTIYLRDSFQLYTRAKGKAGHYIESIDASTLDKDAFFQQFKNIGKANLHIDQNFLIKRVTLKDTVLENCMVFLNCPKPQCLANVSARFYAFYTQSGQGYIDCDAKKVEQSKDEIKNYLEQFNEMHAQIKTDKQPERFMYNQKAISVGAIDLTLALFAALRLLTCAMGLIASSLMRLKSGNDLKQL